MTAPSGNNDAGMSAPNENNGAAWQVYLLRCADMSLYCGITTNLARRLEEHNAGTASRCTRARLPVTLAAAVDAPDKSTALRMELTIKKAPAGQKIELLKNLGAQHVFPEKQPPA